MEQVKSADSGSRLDNIDFRKHSNPYLAIHGSDWREKIESAYHMKQYTCITKMADHIFEETKKVFHNTADRDDWNIYHNDVSLGDCERV